MQCPCRKSGLTLTRRRGRAARFSLVLLRACPGLRIRSPTALRCRALGGSPRDRSADRFADVGRAFDLAANVLREMLGFRTLRARPIAEQQALVRFLIGKMIVDGLRTFGAADRIDDDVVSDLCDAEDVSQQMLDDAKLGFSADATRDMHDAAADFDIDIRGIE